MAPVSSTQEFVTPVAPARMFKALIVDAHNLLPKLMPQTISSIEYVQGSGGPGSIQQTNLPEGAHLKSFKHKIDLLDTQNLVCKRTLIEGDVLSDKLESVNYEAKFEPSSDGGCVCKMTSVYHTKGGVELNEDKIKEGKEKTTGLYKVVEAYLLENPSVYA